ncbi:ubiquitin carboxyl-terminal hydrolase MINDY-2-like [Ptychodera flava]|uniref:ubiquitin carboxyl-terminal hydrolase MINDY-2-like n=1 Tax=Ptychodera flava TaxID=63121 RepID=UPI00396A5B5E
MSEPSISVQSHPDGEDGTTSPNQFKEAGGSPAVETNQSDADGQELPNESTGGKSSPDDDDTQSEGAMDTGSEVEKFDIRGSLQLVEDDASADETQTSPGEEPYSADRTPPSKQGMTEEFDTKVDETDPSSSQAKAEGNQIVQGEPSSEELDEKPETSQAGGGTSQSVYHVKWIKFKGRNMPIVTQNENGPCPLIAIINVLILKGLIVLPDMVEIITSGQLMEYLGDCMLAQTPKNISEAAQLNYEQNMHDAMAVFHKLQTGLDVNVKFTGVSEFEYTPELIVFDLLNIGLFHGWLVDPQNRETVNAIDNCSYNQLVEKIIASKSAKEDATIQAGLVAEQFLENSAAQLTYHGLCELNSTVKEEQLCVFFRNNHFSTIYKHKDELFLLVTDQGFLTENGVVWETLANTEGDSYFVDGDFHTTPPSDTIPPVKDITTEQQINQDYLVALSLQEEQQPAADSEVAAGAPSQGEPQQPPVDVPLSDHDLAMQLQEEENLRAAQAQQAAAWQQQQVQQPQQHHHQQHHHQQQQHSYQQPASRRRPVSHSQEQPHNDKSCNIL